jgi:hypothetical protein
MEAWVMSGWMEAMYFTSKKHYEAAGKDLAYGKQKVFQLR